MVLELTKLEELLGVLMTDLQLIIVVQQHLIKPGAGIMEAFIGIINREENAVGTNLTQAQLQSRVREVAGGSDPDVLGKVLAHRLPAGLLESKVPQTSG